MPGNYALLHILRGSVSTESFDIREKGNVDLISSSSFRRMRRVSHATFGLHQSEQFQPLQELEATRLVSELLADPSNWDEIVKR